MNLYIGNYWCPFPRSEYGGVWIVQAENEEQAIELLQKNSGSWNKEYNHLITDCVAEAEVFTLDASKMSLSDAPRIVKTFFTQDLL